MLPKDGWNKTDFVWGYLSKGFLESFLDEFPSSSAPKGNFGPNELPAIGVYQEILRFETLVKVMWRRDTQRELSPLKNLSCLMKLEQSIIV